MKKGERRDDKKNEVVTLLRSFVVSGGRSDGKNIAKKLARRTGYRLRLSTLSSLTDSVRDWIKTRNRNVINTLRSKTGYVVCMSEKGATGLTGNIRRWVKDADMAAAMHTSRETGYVLNKKTSSCSLSEIVRKAVLSGRRYRDLEERTGYVLRQGEYTTSIAENVRRFVAGDGRIEKEISSRTGYAIRRKGKSKKSLFNCVRQYAVGLSNANKEIVEITGYSLLKRTSLEKRTTNRVMELVRRAVRRNRSASLEITKETGYYMGKIHNSNNNRKIRAPKAGMEDMKLFWGVVKSNASPRTVARAASVASSALRSNTVSSSTILKTLETSFSGDLKASFSNTNNNKDKETKIPDVSLLLKRAREMKRAISNLRSEKIHENVQYRTEPIELTQDNAVRTLLEVSQLTNILKSRIEDSEVNDHDEVKENPRVRRQLNENWMRKLERVREIRLRISKHEVRIPKLVERNRRVSRLRFYDPYVRQREMRKAFQERFETLKVSLLRSKNVAHSLLFRMTSERKKKTETKST
jgi:hypothetical protein